MDALLHMLAGTIVGMSRRWDLILLAAIGKEVYDYYFKTWASVEVLDAAYTILGGMFMKYFLDTLFED